MEASFLPDSTGSPPTRTELRRQNAIISPPPIPSSARRIHLDVHPLPSNDIQVAVDFLQEVLTRDLESLFLKFILTHPEFPSRKFCFRVMEDLDFYLLRIFYNSQMRGEYWVEVFSRPYGTLTDLVKGLKEFRTFKFSYLVSEFFEADVYTVMTKGMRAMDRITQLDGIDTCYACHNDTLIRLEECKHHFCHICRFEWKDECPACKRALPQLRSSDTFFGL